MSRLQRVRFVNEFLESGAKIGLIVAGILAGLQYCSSVEAQKIERVLDYRKQWDSSATLDAQSRLYDFAVARNARMENSVGEARQAIAIDMTEPLATGTGAAPVSTPQRDFALIVDFMEQVDACRTGDVCDGPSVRRFFCDAARSQVAAYASYIEHQRASDQRFGDGLLAVAELDDVDPAAAVEPCVGGRSAGGGSGTG